MDDDVFNMEIRKFLKKVGVTAQREIEQAVRAALENRSLKGDETLRAKVTLTLEPLGISHDVEGKISLT